MVVIRGANLALAFALELAALASLGLWASSLPYATAARFAIGVVAIAAWAAVWGLCFSPKARVALPALARALGQAAMFVVAFIALGSSGRWSAAALLLALTAVNRVLIAAWRQ